jgi:serine/threonine-protein kinase
LLVRLLDQLDPTPLRGLGIPLNPFLSPDGQWIGFADSQTALKKVAVSGGAGILLGAIDGTLRGATWGLDDTIVFATTNPTTGLRQIATSGDEPTVLTRPNRAANEADHFWPQHLPDGESLLFTITAMSGGPDASAIAVLNRRTRIQTILLRGGSDAQYIPTGHLVYHAAGTLHAVPFSLATLAIGAPVRVGPAVVRSASGSALLALADEGTLVYGAGERGQSAARTLDWVDPNGRDIAVFFRSEEDKASIWLLNPALPNLTPLLSEPSEDTAGCRRLLAGEAPRRMVE